jgi:hypothetical protein
MCLRIVKVEKLSTEKQKMPRHDNAYPSRASELIPGFSGFCVAQSLVFCVVCFVDHFMTFFIKKLIETFHFGQI